MGPKRDPKIIVFGIRFSNLLCIFPHSILDVFYNSCFNDLNGFRVALVDRFEYICLSFLERLEPCFLMTV